MDKVHGYFFSLIILSGWLLSCRPVTIDPEARQEVYFMAVEGGGFAGKISSLWVIDGHGQRLDFTQISGFRGWESGERGGIWPLEAVRHNLALGAPVRETLDSRLLARLVEKIPPNEGVRRNEEETCCDLVGTAFYAFHYDAEQAGYQVILLATLGYEHRTAEGRRLAKALDKL